MPKEQKPQAAEPTMPSPPNPVAEEAAAVWALISTLKPWTRNPKKHPPDQLENIACAVIELGWGNVVLARLDNREVIAGHGRLQSVPVLKKMWRRAKPAERETWHPDAIRIVERGQVPTRLCTLDEARAHLLALADNKIAEASPWDKEELGSILDSYSLAEAETAGFSEDEYFDLVGDDETPDLEDLEDSGELKVEPRAKLGDVWLLGEHRLMCGSSTHGEQVARLMAWNKADLMFTDPPYGVKYRDKAGEDGGSKFEAIENDELDPVALRAFLDEVFTCAKLALRPGAPTYVCHANQKPGIYGAFEGAFLAAGFFISAVLVWVKKAVGSDKVNATMGWQDYRSGYEPILYGWLEGGEHIKVADRTETNVWELARDAPTSYIHPTQKPVELPARALKNSSHEGDAVYEPFSGSGSTLMACEKLGRRCFAMELKPAYVDAAIARWERATGKVAELEPVAA